MSWTKVKGVAAGIMIAVGVLGTAVPVPGQAQTAAGPASVPTAEQFDQVAALVRPLPGEYNWRDEIPWEGRIQAARIKAVAEDKPMLILASANAFALGRT